MTGSESPAAVLRRAAELMKSRIAELPPSPWRAEGRDVTATQDYQDDGSWDWGRGYVIAACPRQDEAEHVASWSPPVALAVADWLDDVARQADEEIELYVPACTHDEPCRCDLSPAWGCDRCGEWLSGSCNCWGKALAVARTFLGEETPA